MVSTGASPPALFVFQSGLVRAARYVASCVRYFPQLILYMNFLDAIVVSSALLSNTH